MGKMIQLELFPATEEQSTSSLEAHRAKTHHAREKGQGLSKGQGQNSPSHIPAWLTNWRPIEDFAGYAGRTSPGCSASIPDATSPHFFRVSSDGRLLRPSEDGKTSESSPSPATGTSEWRGEYWTANMPEWTGFQGPSPSGGDVCSLSDILVTGDVPQEYFLSQRACLGILRRADARERKLPKALRDVLSAQAGMEATTM